jgi:phospholipase C
MAPIKTRGDPMRIYTALAVGTALLLTPVASAQSAADPATPIHHLVVIFQGNNSCNLPTVTFIKAPATQTGHPNTSSALQEQQFLVTTINQLQASPMWRDMAIIITYDDSDGWYDHVMPPIVSPSNDPANDALAGPGNCGTPAPDAYLDRCGYGTRLPFLVISPFAKSNNVDSTITDTSSVLRFVEDNWGLGRIGDQSLDVSAGPILNHFDFNRSRNTRLALDPSTGEPVGDKNLARP